MFQKQSRSRHPLQKGTSRTATSRRVKIIPKSAVILVCSFFCYGCFEGVASPEEPFCPETTVNSSVIAAGANKDSLFKVNEGEVWGFIDSNGNAIVEPRFKEVTDFSEGLAAVKSVWDGRWGYIDASGSIVIEPVFNFATPFSEGRAVVTVDGNQGLIDKSGEYVLPPTFKKITKFSQERAFVLVKDNWQLVDESGRYVTQNSFKQVRGFREGLAVFTGFNDDYDIQGYIDREGSISILAGDDFSIDIEGIGFSYGRAPVYRLRTNLLSILWGRPSRRVYGLINNAGELIIPLKYELIDIDSPCRAITIANSQYGVIDLEGNVVVQNHYNYIGDFSEGLALIQRNPGDKYGYIDGHGRLIIEPIQAIRAMPSEFSWSRNFHDGRALFRGTEGRYGYIDKSGSIVIEPNFDKAYPFKNGLARFENVDEWGYIDLSGNIVWFSDGPIDESRILNRVSKMFILSSVVRNS
ncbi:MAG: WG repeat-containing protein [Leptolyngbyaceae cyanobacterium]